jgi:hypothetical protein
MAWVFSGIIESDETQTAPVLLLLRSSFCLDCVAQCYTGKMSNVLSDRSSGGNDSGNQ